MRNLFARETLGEASAAPAPAGPRRRFAALLFGREPLAIEAEPAHRARGPGLLRLLFGSEPLPEDPEEAPGRAGPGRHGLLRALFAPEPIEDLPAAPPRPKRSAWLRWLFHFERLGPP